MILGYIYENKIDLLEMNLVYLTFASHLTTTTTRVCSCESVQWSVVFLSWHYMSMSCSGFALEII